MVGALLWVSEKPRPRALDTVDVMNKVVVAVGLAEPDRQLRVRSCVALKVREREVG